MDAIRNLLLEILIKIFELGLRTFLKLLYSLIRKLLKECRILFFKLFLQKLLLGGINLRRLAH